MIKKKGVVHIIKSAAARCHFDVIMLGTKPQTGSTTNRSPFEAHTRGMIISLIALWNNFTLKSICYCVGVWCFVCAKFTVK